MAPPAVGGGQGDGHLQGGERGPGVASGHVHQVGEGVVLDGRALDVERPADQHGQVVLRERLDPEHHRPADERGVHLEEGILGRGPDEGEDALLDRGQQRVLLGLVEAVDLVEEQDRAAVVVGQPGPRLGDDLAHVPHACGHRGQGHELPVGLGGHDPGQRGLAGPGRPPQDDRRQPVGLDQRPQRRPVPDQVALPDHVLQRAGPHPRRQGRLPGQPLLQRSLGGIRRRRSRAVGPTCRHGRRLPAAGDGDARRPGRSVPGRVAVARADRPGVGGGPACVVPGGPERAAVAGPRRCLAGVAVLPAAVEALPPRPLDIDRHGRPGWRDRRGRACGTPRWGQPSACEANPGSHALVSLSVVA